MTIYTQLSSCFFFLGGLFVVILYSIKCGRNLYGTQKSCQAKIFKGQKMLRFLSLIMKSTKETNMTKKQKLFFRIWTILLFYWNKRPKRVSNILQVATNYKSENYNQFIFWVIYVYIQVRSFLLE